MSTYFIQGLSRRKKCGYCEEPTEKWEKAGSTYYCYDGCYSTTGQDYRTVDGLPAWLPVGDKPAWDPSRMVKNLK